MNNSHIAGRRYRSLLISVVLTGFAFGALVGCGDSRSPSNSSANVSQKILGGSEVLAPEQTALVKIRVRHLNDVELFCSGTALSATTVLTAAHCFSPTYAGISDQLTACPSGAACAIDGTKLSIEVSMGSLVTPALKLHIAPGYLEDAATNAIFNDLALLTVAALPGPFATLAGPINLTLDQEFSVYGFGVDQSGSYGILRSGQLRLALVTPNHLFSEPYFEDGVNSCAGDSGGPLFKNSVGTDGSSTSALIGVVSSGTLSDCGPGDVTLFTNVLNPALLEFAQSVDPSISVAAATPPPAL